MKKMILTAALAFSTLNMNAATKNDTLVVTTTPIMHCEKCENKIKSNIRFVKGTKKILTSVPNQTVTIVYDGKKATPTDYTDAFKKIGYEVKTVSAGAKCAAGKSTEGKCTKGKSTGSKCSEGKCCENKSAKTDCNTGATSKAESSKTSKSK